VRREKGKEKKERKRVSFFIFLSRIFKFEGHKVMVTERDVCSHQVNKRVESLGGEWINNEPIKLSARSIPLGVVNTSPWGRESGTTLRSPPMIQRGERSFWSMGVGTVTSQP